MQANHQSGLKQYSQKHWLAQQMPVAPAAAQAPGNTANPRRGGYRHPGRHGTQNTQTRQLTPANMLRCDGNRNKLTNTSPCFNLPAICSCLGQIPLDDVDKQSSSSGVTWMPTSTGLDAFFSSLGEGEGGLSAAFSRQRLPLHCFRLCSIKIRMSPNGKFIWHWPQVRRSWSPSGAPNVPCSGSSSVRMASRGSAAVWETKGEWLELSGKAPGAGGGMHWAPSSWILHPALESQQKKSCSPPTKPTQHSTEDRDSSVTGKRFCQSSCSMQNSDGEHCNCLCVPTRGHISDSLNNSVLKLNAQAEKNTLRNSCGTRTSREYGVLLLNVLFMYMNSRLKAQHTLSHTWVCIFHQPNPLSKIQKHSVDRRCFNMHRHCTFPVRPCR